MPRHCSLAVFVAGWLVMTGCAREVPATPNAAPVDHAQNQPLAEPTWESQIAAVREGNADSIRVTGPVRGDQIALLAEGCESLQTLTIDRGPFPPAGYASLSQLPNLRWLKLPNGPADHEFGAILACNKLTNLNLPESTLSDEGFRRLSKLLNLELLRIGSPTISDEGLEVLKRLPNLRFLHLIDVPISDTGLDTIAELTTLESFYLDGGQTTDEGLSRLLQRRPALHFHKDQRHLPGDANAHPH